MESLMSDISENIPIEFGRGLIGISLAMDFIMKYFKKGNPDYVLDDIDAVLYKSLDISNFKKFMNLGLVSEGLFYISVHLKYGIVNDYKKRLYEKKAISLLEYIYTNRQNKWFAEEYPGLLFCNEFFFLYSLCLMYEQGIYQTRIEHICKEIIIELFASIPSLHYNRLIRLFLVSKIINVVKVTHVWDEYFELLRGNISVKYLIEEECSRNRLYLSDGLTGIYIMLYMINRLRNTTVFELNWDYYTALILNNKSLISLRNNTTISTGIGINGYWGINYLLKTISKKNLYQL